MDIHLTTHDRQTSQCKQLLVPAVRPAFVFMSGVLSLKGKFIQSGGRLDLKSGVTCGAYRAKTETEQRVLMLALTRTDVDFEWKQE